jgi:hypothetical protein
MKRNYLLSTLLIVFILLFSFGCRRGDEDTDNANLSSLTISSGRLSPSFSKNITSYSVVYEVNVTSVTVTPTAESRNSTITVNSVRVSSGQASGPINLVTGLNTITIVVTSEDGTEKTYTVDLMTYGQFKVANQWGTGTGWENVPDGCLWITYAAMLQNQVLCMFVEDRAGYTPVYLVRFNISHSHRSDCKITVGVQTDSGTVIAEKEFNGYFLSSGDSPYPGTAMVVDVTELSSHFNEGDVFLEVYDLVSGESYSPYSDYKGTGTTGTITYFAIEKYSEYTSTTKTLAQQQGGAVNQDTSNGSNVKLTIDTNGTQPIGSPPGGSGSTIKSSRIQELFNVRRLTDSEIKELKNLVGVYDSSRNYNIIINGFGTGFIPPSEEQWEQIQKNYFTIDSIKSGTILNSHPSAGGLLASRYLPPIGDQRTEGSCVSWAVAYYTKTFQEALENNWDLSLTSWTGTEPDSNQDKIFSPDFLYHQFNDGSLGGGSYFDDNLQIIDVIGCATWSTMPTSDSNGTLWPGTTAWEEAALYRGELSTSPQDWGASNGYWFYVQSARDINVVRLLIDNNIPVIIGIDANQYYDLDANDTWTTGNYSNPDINHANTIIGYVDN